MSLACHSGRTGLARPQDPVSHSDLPRLSSHPRRTRGPHPEILDQLATVSVTTSVPRPWLDQRIRWKVGVGTSAEEADRSPDRFRDSGCGQRR